MDPFQDWWKQYTATCTFCWDSWVFPPIGDQERTNACMAFSLVALFNGYLRSDQQLVTLSEQQLADVFRNPGPSVSEITDYIHMCGLLENAVYPWRFNGIPQDFVIPNPPVTLYRALWRFPHKKNNFQFEQTIMIRPIASYFVVTKSYVDWENGGCHGVFKYHDWEEAQVYAMLTNPNPNSNIVSHSVVLMGFGVEEGVEFYLARDSHGTSINNGYRKLTTSAFNEGMFIDRSDSIVSQTSMSTEYQRLVNYRRPPRLPPPPEQFDRAVHSDHGRFRAPQRSGASGRRDVNSYTQTADPILEARFALTGLRSFWKIFTVKRTSLISEYAVRLFSTLPITLTTVMTAIS